MLLGTNIVRETICQPKNSFCREVLTSVCDDQAAVEFGADKDEFALNLDARELPLIHADAFKRWTGKTPREMRTAGAY